MTAVEPAPAATLNDGAAPIGAWAYFGGSVVPIQSARVSIATNTFNYGRPCSRGSAPTARTTARWRRLLGLEDYERLLRNARLLRAAVPETAQQLTDITLELLRRNAHVGHAYLRPLVYKSARSIRVQLTGLDDAVAIFTMPLGDYLPTGGIRVTVSGWSARSQRHPARADSAART